MREVAAEFERPALLFSGGKDSGGTTAGGSSHGGIDMDMLSRHGFLK